MSKDDEWFVIKDLDKFIESSRVLVFQTFGQTNKESPDELSIAMDDLTDDESTELDNVLSQEECMIIAKTYIKIQKHKKTQRPRFIISEESYVAMIEAFNSRMVSNMLNHLVNKGILETAYDDQCNDFVFWVKEDENNAQKPETD